MRRRRNQSHTGNGITQFGDLRRDLMPRKLTAFTGFCPLRHFNLQHIRIG
ncbi:Uncharacterised protein [Vibrio cholerae]|uniref:Uncharacterized protein n=1 Tax=Vibrio cholerae TaxID=666 RepID=A0A655PBH1_VIBCL|nr:Uncharacterised protein [Vibrio cholerae]